MLIKQGEDVAQQIIDEAHRQGLKIIVYYWHMSEQTLAEGIKDPDSGCIVKAHPEWVCLRSDRNTPRESPRGTWLDITGPYREVVLTRMLELADRGADGFNFDHLHLPPEGCWGTALEEAWIAETGEPAPAPPKPEEQPAPRYLEFLEFRARKIEDTFIYWRDQVKAKHPDVVFVISADGFGRLDRVATTRLARIADSPKNEYNVAYKPAAVKVFEDHSGVLAKPDQHVRQAFGWTALRDAADGRAPRIWVSGVPSSDQAKEVAGSLLTFGSVAAMDVAEANILGDEPVPGTTPVEGLTAAFALGDVVSPHLARTRPLRWAAVHFPEDIRNAHDDDHLAAWRQVLWPMVGAYQVLSEDGLPVGVVNDHQLEHGQLHGCTLLFLPKRGELTPAQRRTVALFKAAGGVVIANDPDWPWSYPGGTAQAAASFRAELAEHVATAPVRVTGGPAGGYAVSYHRPKRLVVAVTNGFGWVQITKRDDVPEQINAAPPAAEGVQVTWKPELLPPSVAPPLSRPRAVEAVSGTELDVHPFESGYRVYLPAFPFMALLVVTQE